MVDFTAADVSEDVFGGVVADETPVQALLMHRIFSAAESLSRQGIEVNVQTLNGEDQRLGLDVLERALPSRVIQAGLRARGIEVGAPLNELTVEQRAFLAIYLDMSNPATHRAKLRAAGVTQRQLDGWMRQPIFRQEMAALSEERLRSVQPLAFERLSEMVDQGNFKAIEMVLEVLGRHDRRQGTVDVQAVLMGVFSVLDEELASVPGGDEVMRRVAARMRNAMAGQQLNPQRRREPATLEVQEIEA